MSNIKTLNAKTCKQTKIAILIAFVLFGLSGPTLNSCKKCSKDEPTGRNTQNLITDDSGKTGDSNPAVPGGSTPPASVQDNPNSTTTTSASGGGGVISASPETMLEELTPLQKALELCKAKIEKMRDEAKKQAEAAQAEITNVINGSTQELREQARDRANTAFGKLENYEENAQDALEVFFDNDAKAKVLADDAKALDLFESAAKTMEEMIVWVEKASSASDTVVSIDYDDKLGDRLEKVAKKAEEEAEKAKNEAKKGKDKALKNRRDAAARDMADVNKVTFMKIDMLMVRVHAWRARLEANRAKEAAGRVDRKLLPGDYDYIDLDSYAQDAEDFAKEAEQLAGKTNL
jgi:hypothetical protein